MGCGRDEGVGRGFEFLNDFVDFVPATEAVAEPGIEGLLRQEDGGFVDEAVEGFRGQRAVFADFAAG